MRQFVKTARWTGSHFGKTEITTKPANYSIFDEDCGEGLHNYIFKLKTECKKDEEFSYGFKTHLTDEQGIMKPYLGYKVTSKTDKLNLKVSFLKSGFKKIPIEVKLVLYADHSKGIIYSESELKVENSSDYYIFKADEIENPFILYTYAIEWKYQ